MVKFLSAEDALHTSLGQRPRLELKLTRRAEGPLQF